MKSFSFDRSYRGDVSRGTKCDIGGQSTGALLMKGYMRLAGQATGALTGVGMKRSRLWCANPMMVPIKAMPNTELAPTATQKRHCISTAGICQHRANAAIVGSRGSADAPLQRCDGLRTLRT